MNRWLRVVASLSLVPACVIIEPEPEPPPPPPPMPLPETEIVVEAAPPGATGGALRVALVAFRDGDDGPWQAMFGGAGRYSARTRTGRYGVALACQPFEFRSGVATTLVSVHHATVQDTVKISDHTCYEAASTEQTLSGTMTGVGVGERGVAQLSGLVWNNVAADGTFSLTAPAGHHALIATVHAATGPLTSPLRALRLPDVTLPRTTPLAIDASAAVPLVSYPVTLPPSAAAPSVSSSLNVRGEPMMRVRGTASQYLTLPASELRRGDLVRVLASVRDDELHQRDTAVYLGAPGPATLPLPTPLVVPTPQIPRTGRRLARFELPAEASRLAHVDTLLSLRTENETTDVLQNITLHRRWLGTRAAVYTFPDLSTAQGHTPAMELLPATEVLWTAARQEWSSRDPIAGAVYLGAFAEGTVAP